MPELTPAQRTAFAALFSREAPRLYRTALGLLGHREEAADALQETGLKALRYFGTLQNGESGSAWLTRILINLCHDLGRRRGRMVPVGLEPATERGALDEETDWTLLAALGTLSEEQRVTVGLRFFQDLSLPQIAEIMAVPEGTVKSRLHAALGKLRTALGPTREEEAR